MSLANDTNLTIHRFVNVADDLPDAGGGTWAAIVAGILFVLGFASTIAIYYLNHTIQTKARDDARQLQRSAAGGSPAMFRSLSPDGIPMTHQKTIEMMMFDESPSRSSTPDFDPLAPSSHHHVAASFRVPSSPPGYGVPPTAAHQSRGVAPPSAAAASYELNRGQSSYFVDSDEELLESRRRPSAPQVGGSRVHLHAASNKQYFDEM
ncbi:membrane-associated protein, putative [Bodo saltans]|uniref:Membrane-associated protein, putative n=1 Tax=Bodo saltans TaxID=75058 RepID=A0A0S4JCA8_BODSA|nr:membrane-associated protein, putative [Bodo saltans]|eukprot:CUG89175.1 membrane-associated protein, putative [Bodo saltans]